MKEDSTLAKLRRRLNRWELDHLREHARQLSERIDDLTAELSLARLQLSDADSCAEYWREQVMQLTEQLADDVAIGITKSGDMGIVAVGKARAAGDQRPLTKHATKPVVKAAGGKAGA